ncbi:TAXI family TRAP transporter solute-binding subunit [Acuticoccus sp.]|uniref:TAXI family TRAP transporter solute-binding subunit n=1 Tax=Acuticoccus sp. TaxID=1904378 RepID=UPI003B52AA71
MWREARCSDRLLAGAVAGLGLTLAISAVPTSSAIAQNASDIELPRQLSWTAYGTGSAGYSQAVAIGAALQDAVGTNLRILPGKNDISRTEPLRRGRVDFSAAGIACLMAQEAVYEFAEESWGPLPIRVAIANFQGGQGQSVATSVQSGVTEYSDMKGLRVPWVVGAPALNVNMEAYLAFGGLTWDDVEKVEFGGYGAAWKGFIEGQTDAGFGSTNSGPVYEAAASPQGIYWPEMDPDDTEAWDRMLAVAPWYTPTVATVGANIDGGGEYRGATYAYPVLITMAEQEDDLVYNMTKAMVELHPEYSGKVPGIDGWNLEFQDFQWVMPYHDGAIRYYKEAGVWSDEAQAHNDNLVARQETLMAAWEDLKAANPDDWESAWSEARREALEEGGFEVYF